MISVVAWLWRDGGRDFRADHVNSLARAFKSKCTIAHRFICIADSPEGLAAPVEYVETPAAARRLAALRTPEGERFPSCFRRLWMFSPDARALGARVLLVDIDLVVTADPAPLFDYDHDFVGWRPRMKWGNNQRIGGGLYLLKTGRRAFVWETFNGAESIAAARRAGFRGSDQAWMSHCLADNFVWPASAGIYSIRDLREGRLPLPPDARLVQFNGPRKPWTSTLSWVKDHWV